MKNTINKILFMLGLCSLLQACSQEPDYKTIRQQVIDQHDKLMDDDEKAMNYKMKLDTAVMPSGLQKLKQTQPQLDTAREKQQINTLIKQLNDADEAMNNWMHKFNPDVQGESNDRAVNYFKAEKLKVIKLDSIYQVALKAAGQELNKLQISIRNNKAGAPMKMKM